LKEVKDFNLRSLRSKSLKTASIPDASAEEEGRNEELYHRMQKLLRRHMFGEKKKQIKAK